MCALVEKLPPQNFSSAAWHWKFQTNAFYTSKWLSHIEQPLQRKTSEMYILSAKNVQIKHQMAPPPTSDTTIFPPNTSSKCCCPSSVWLSLRNQTFKRNHPLRDFGGRFPTCVLPGLRALRWSNLGAPEIGGGRGERGEGEGGENNSHKI